MTGQTALVVDDSRSARYAMRKLLEGSGYTVDTAESAQDAYVYLQRKMPAIIFLDHQMPGTNGLDVLRALKRNTSTSNIPIVICSSDRHLTFLRVARDAGATDVLAKPPDNDQFRALMHQLGNGAVQPEESSGSDNDSRVTTVVIGETRNNWQDALSPKPARTNAPDVARQDDSELDRLKSELSALKMEMELLRQEQQRPMNDLVDELLPSLLRAMEAPLRNRARHTTARVLQRVAERLLQEANNLPNTQDDESN